MHLNWLEKKELLLKARRIFIGAEKFVRYHLNELPFPTKCSMPIIEIESDAVCLKASLWINADQTYEEPVHEKIVWIINEEALLNVTSTLAPPADHKLSVTSDKGVHLLEWMLPIENVPKVMLNPGNLNQKNVLTQQTC